MRVRVKKPNLRQRMRLKMHHPSLALLPVAKLELVKPELVKLELVKMGLVGQLQAKLVRLVCRAGACANVGRWALPWPMMNTTMPPRSKARQLGQVHCVPGRVPQPPSYPCGVNKTARPLLRLRASYLAKHLAKHLACHLAKLTVTAKTVRPRSALWARPFRHCLIPLRVAKALAAHLAAKAASATCSP